MESGEPKDSKIGPLVKAAINLGAEVVTIDGQVPTKEELAEIEAIKLENAITRGDKPIKQ